MENVRRENIMVKVSVVIPTHNRSELLINSIKSVLKQDFEDFEVIIVDDASSDDTAEKVKCIKDQRLKYYKIEKPKGGNHARNFGVNKSEGEYVAFLDDDDEWHPGKLSKQLQKFEAKKTVGLVYTAVEIIYTDENVKYVTRPKEDGDLSKKILLKNHIGTTSCVMAKKTILEEVGGFDEKLPARQDYDLWIRICKLCDVAFVDEPLVLYYNRNNSTQVSTNIEKYLRAVEIMEQKYEDDFLQLSKREQKYIKSKVCFSAGNRLIRNKDCREGRKYLLRSMRMKFTIKSFALYLLSFLSYKWILKLKSR